MSYRALLEAYTRTAYKLSKAEKAIATTKLEGLPIHYTVYNDEISEDTVKCIDIGFSTDPMLNFDMRDGKGRGKLEFKVTDISLDNIVPQQQCCRIDKLKEYIDENKEELSEVILFNGKYYTLDHHRIAVLILAKRSIAKVLLAKVNDDHFEDL